MAIREKMKRAFTRSSRSSDTSSNVSRENTKDSNIYQPGERMPPMKYRRPVAKEHKEKLEAFSFAKAWRRRSDCASQYSPMGSRMPSRRGSLKSRKSYQGNRQTSTALAHTVENTNDDTNLFNIGLSRPHTREDKPIKPIPRRGTVDMGRPKSKRSVDSRSATHESNGHSTPFKPEDLTLALKRSIIPQAQAVH